jgi:hypothetical protein
VAKIDEVKPVTGDAKDEIVSKKGRKRAQTLASGAERKKEDKCIVM